MKEKEKEIISKVKVLLSSVLFKGMTGQFTLEDKQEPVIMFISFKEDKDNTGLVKLTQEVRYTSCVIK